MVKNKDLLFKMHRHYHQSSGMEYKVNDHLSFDQIDGTHLRQVNLFRLRGVVSVYDEICSKNLQILKSLSAIDPYKLKIEHLKVVHIQQDQLETDNHDFTDGLFRFVRNTERITFEVHNNELGANLNKA